MSGGDPDPAPLRVLFVEDREEDVELGLIELRRSGFLPEHRRVDVRGELVAALDGQEWDVILCDHGLPSFSAGETIRILAERGLDIPVIMVSGQIGEDAAIEALKGGAADYVLKGNLRRLGPSVRSVLRGVREKARRRTAEDRLRREAALRHAFVEHAIHGICRVSLVGRILMANPALFAMLGRSHDDGLVGSVLPEIAFVEPATWKRLAETCLRTGRIAPEEMTWRRSDGKVLQVRLSGTLASESGRGPQAIDGIVEDVTELRAVEAQFLHAQKMEAVGRLAGGVAHDFNNLLTVIQGYSELMEACFSPGTNEREWLEEIRRATVRAAALSRQLLAFSRQGTVRLRVVDVNDLLRDLARMLERLIGSQIVLETIPSAEPAFVRVDVGQFEQVVANLVVNARDAMPDGGRIEIRVDVPAPGDRVRVSLSDTGHGMDAETRKRIFEPFFTTKREGKGTGLGLATVLAIVDRSGGTVEVESEPGKGATFRVLLPRVEEAPEAVVPEILPGVRGGTETVLLVEDEESLRTLLEGGLRGAGYLVIAAGNGAEAVERARAHAGPIHLMVSDMVMPGIAWRDLVRGFAAARPAVPILLMSGYAGEDASTIRAGPGDPPVLEKPFAVEGFLREVRRALDAAAART